MLDSEGGKGTALDGENTDNCFNSIQVCIFRKSEVKMTETGTFWTNSDIKVTISLRNPKISHFTNLLKNIISFCERVS